MSTTQKAWEYLRVLRQYAQYRRYDQTGATEFVAVDMSGYRGYDVPEESKKAEKGGLRGGVGGRDRCYIRLMNSPGKRGFYEDTEVFENWWS